MFSCGKASFPTKKVTTKLTEHLTVKGLRIKEIQYVAFLKLIRSWNTFFTACLSLSLLQDRVGKCYAGGVFTIVKMIVLL